MRTRTVWIQTIKRPGCLIYPLAAALCGLCCGQKQLPLITCIAYVPVFWLLAPSRFAAWLTAFVYYLAASRDIPAGAAVFFGSSAALTSGYVMYIGSSLVLSLPWAILWGKIQGLTHSLARVGALLLVLAVPPLGVIGWANPLVAAGTVFKGWGLWGVLALPVWCGSTAYMIRKNRWHFLALFVWGCVAFCHAPVRVQPHGWSGIDTEIAGLASGNYDLFISLTRSSALSEKILESQAAYILTPETGTGQWSKASAQFWSPVSALLARSGRTAVIGAEEFDALGRYDNTLRFIGHDGGHVYRQRFPVPVSMWRPWGGPVTARAHWFDSGTITLRTGEKALCLLCYEQLLTFPYLTGMIFKKPDLIIAASNTWWARETSLPQAMKQCLYAWARLCDAPVIIAENI